MTDLRLGKLPNRTRAKLVLDLGPELDEQLRLYATMHAARHGEDVAAADIAPFMLAEYLEADREFQKALRAAKTRAGG